jgi:23S rRNA (pseudouridine1915-N3)-methyltransferase
MRLSVIAVGRGQKSPEQQLFETYRDRLARPWSLSLSEIVVKTARDADHRRTLEGEKILAALPREERCIALDVQGRSEATETFARRLQQWREAGAIPTHFVIGGADGLSAAVRQRADGRLSLGPMTWPHLLVRAMLAEQIYRAVSWLEGHPYHRE